MSSSAHVGSNSPRSLSNIHIVVDNSNVYIGAQSGQGKNGEQDYDIRTNVANLVEIIEKDKDIRNIKTRIVGGSTPPRTARVWSEWEKCKYTCLLGERSFSNREVFLDDMLHSQIQNLILKNKTDRKNAQQNLILITGDGNANDNRTTFPDIVSTALEYGWTVDIWSWKASLSYKFGLLQKQYPSKIKINYLDTYRSKITFKQKQKQKQHQDTINIKSLTLIVLGSSIVLSILIYYFKNL